MGRDRSWNYISMLPYTFIQYNLLFQVYSTEWWAFFQSKIFTKLYIFQIPAKSWAFVSLVRCLCLLPNNSLTNVSIWRMTSVIIFPPTPYLHFQKERNFIRLFFYFIKNLLETKISVKRQLNMHLGLVKHAVRFEKLL